MHPLAETLLNEPVIAAVKTDEALTAALASPCSAVFLLASTLLTVDGLVLHHIKENLITARIQRIRNVRNNKKNFLSHTN